MLTITATREEQDMGHTEREVVDGIPEQNTPSRKGKEAVGTSERNEDSDPVVLEKIENLFRGYEYICVKFEETVKEVNDLKRKHTEDMEEIKILKNKVQLLEEGQKETRIEEVNFLNNRKILFT